jgi:hypothetical protein
MDWSKYSNCSSLSCHIRSLYSLSRYQRELSMFLEYPVTSHKFEDEGTYDNDVWFFSKFRELKYHQRTLVIWCETPCFPVDGSAYWRNLLLPSSVWEWKMETVCCPETLINFYQPVRRHTTKQSVLHSHVENEILRTCICLLLTVIVPFAVSNCGNHEQQCNERV